MCKRSTTNDFITQVLYKRRKSTHKDRDSKRERERDTKNTDLWEEENKMDFGKKYLVYGKEGSVYAIENKNSFTILDEKNKYVRSSKSYRGHLDASKRSTMTF